MEKRRMSLFLPVLLVLAAAMFASNLGGDSPSGMAINDGESAECIACKNKCTKTFNDCMEVANDELRTCIGELGSVCDEAEACINAAKTHTALNRCKLLMGKCNALIQSCVEIAGKADVCENNYVGCMEKCNKNECKKKGRDWRSPIGAIFG